MLQAIFYADGEFNPARARKVPRVPLISSTSVLLKKLMAMATDGFNCIGEFLHGRYLPYLNEQKRTIPKGLIVILDAMSSAWRPHNIGTAHSLYTHGIGIQIGKSDPAFMARYGKQPMTDEHPGFPYNPAEIDRRLLNGDPQIQEVISIINNYVCVSALSYFIADRDF